MPSVGEIVHFLAQISELHADWKGDVPGLDLPVTGLQLDQQAGPGDLAWISPRQVNLRPGSVAEFKGSLLIAPAGMETFQKPVLTTLKPKLAFIRAAIQFFSHLAQVDWVEAHIPSAHEKLKLAPGVVLGPHVFIEGNVEIGPNTVIANTTLKNNVSIGANCTIGLPGFGFEKDEDGRYWRFPHTGGVVLSEDVEIGSNTCIDRGSIGNTIIGRGVKIDNLVHIAHNVTIGENSVVIANSMIGGSTIIEANVWVAPSASLMNQIHVGEAAVLGLGTVVLKDVEARQVMVGNPARPLSKGQSNE